MTAKGFDLRNLTIVLLIGVAIATALLADHYRRNAGRVQTELHALQAAVKQQNTQAEQTLAELTRQRDAAQTLADAAYQQQEVIDAAHQETIARLSDELIARPVRVRIVPQTCAGGARGSRPDSHAAASADAGTTNKAETFGLLPAANTQRLGAVIAEIETINAAYASCRARLYMQEGSVP